MIKKRELSHLSLLKVLFQRSLIKLIAYIVVVLINFTPSEALAGHFKQVIPFEVVIDKKLSSGVAFLFTPFSIDNKIMFFLYLNFNLENYIYESTFALLSYNIN